MTRLTLLLLIVGCGKDSSGPSADASTTDTNSTSDGMIIDAPGPDANTAGIACGMTMTCAAGMECCVTFGQGGSTTYSCIAAGGACQGASLECDGPEDCVTGERCCGGNGATCESGGGQCRELCHSATDCSMTGAMCCASNFGFGNYCAAMCF